MQRFLLFILLAALPSWSLWAQCADAQGLDLYWVGVNGSGDFNNPAHWRVGSVSSAQEPCQSPRSSDNVYFVSASFPSVGAIVDIAANASCNNMFWEAAIPAAQVPRLRCTNINVNLDVHGGMALAAAMQWQFSGNLRFKSVQPAGTVHEITTATRRLLVNSLVFESTNLVEYRLMDNLYVDDPAQTNNYTDGQLWLNSGYLNANGFDMRLEGLTSKTNNARRGLNISGAQITLFRAYTSAYSWDIDFNSTLAVRNYAIFEAAGSHIFHKGTGANYMRLGVGMHYDSLTIDRDFFAPTNDYDPTLTMNLSQGEHDTLEHLYLQRATILTGGANARLVARNLYVYGHTFLHATGGVKLLEVDNIQNLSTCGEYASIGALSARSLFDQITLRKMTAGGVLNMNNLILTRVVGDVAGGSSYVAVNSVARGGVSNITVTGQTGRQMYFRAAAGSSNWSNVANWQDWNGSVFTPSACLPTPFDDVYFDASSFPAVGGVDITRRSFCRDMVWLPSIPTGARLRVANALSVFGDLRYDSKMTFAAAGARQIWLCGRNPDTIAANGAVNTPIRVSVEMYGDYRIVGNYRGWILGDQGSYLRMQADTLRPTTAFSVHFADFHGTQLYIVEGGSWAYYQFDHSATAINYSGNATVHWEHNAPIDWYSFYGGYLPNLVVSGRINAAYHNVFIRGNLTLRENATMILGNTQFGGTTDGNLRVIGGLNGAAGDVLMQAGSSLVCTPYLGSRVIISGGLTAVGNCQKNVFIGTVNGLPLPGGFSVAGAVDVQFANIQGLGNVSPAPNTNISAFNSIDLGNNTNWTFTAAASQTFYWRAHQDDATDFIGLWSDPAHWTTNPASPVGDSACVPSAVDDVVFDAMSFSAASNGCTVAANARCRDISVQVPVRWVIGTATLDCRHLRFSHSGAIWESQLASYSSSPSNIVVRGDLELASNMSTPHYRGTLAMTGSGSIRSNGTRLQVRSLNFNNPTGVWHLLDALYLDNDWGGTNSTNRRCGELILTAGSLHSNDQPITVSSYFTCASGQPRALHLGNSTLTHRSTANYLFWWGPAIWNVSGSAFTFTYGTNAEIIIQPSSTFSPLNVALNFHMGSGVNYPSVSISDDNDVINLYGNANYRYLQLNGTAYVDGSNTMDSLRLEGGYFYRFRAGTTQTLRAPHGKIISNGTSGNFVNIESHSAGSSFRIHKPYGAAFCIDFVKVKDCIGSKESNMALVPTTPVDYQLMHPFLEFQTGTNSDNIGGTATGIWAFNLPLLVTPQYAGANIVQACASSGASSFNIPVTGTSPYLVNYTWTSGSSNGSATFTANDNDGNSSTPAFVNVPIHSGNPSITYTFNITTLRCGDETTPLTRNVTVQQPSAAVLTQTAQNATCTFNNSADWLTLIGVTDQRPIVSIQDYTGAGDSHALGELTTQVFFDASVQQVNIGGIMYPYMQRHWRITPTHNGAANVRIYFTQAELNALIAATPFSYVPFTSASQLQIVRYASGTIGVGAAEIIPYTIIPLTGAAAAPFSSTTNVYAFEFSVPSFSHFILTPSQSTFLDNNLLSFSAQAAQPNNPASRVVHIAWTVEHSQDAAQYAIERSGDAQQSQTIAQIASRQLAQRDAYTYTDEQALNGYNYYRLRCTEVDGSVWYSAWKSLHFGNERTSIQLAPNPADNQSTVLLSEAESARISVFNHLGQCLLTQEFAASAAHRLDLSTLTSGVYSLRIELQSGATQTLRLVKQ